MQTEETIQSLLDSLEKRLPNIASQFASNMRESQIVVLKWVLNKT